MTEKENSKQYELNRRQIGSISALVRVLDVAYQSLPDELENEVGRINGIQWQDGMTIRVDGVILESLIGKMEGYFGQPVRREEVTLYYTEKNWDRTVEDLKRRTDLLKQVLEGGDCLV